MTRVELWLPGKSLTGIVETPEGIATTDQVELWTATKLPDIFQEADVNRELLLSIFRDAHVVDIDMSDWDQCIRLAVVAMEATAFPARRLPVYIVELQRVTEFAVKFGHHERAPDFGHYQWNVDSVQLEDTDEGFRLRLSGSRLMPVFTISFAGLEMRQLDNSMLDRRFPGWSKPGASFIRSGIEQQVEEKKRKP